MYSSGWYRFLTCRKRVECMGGVDAARRVILGYEASVAD